MTEYRWFYAVGIAAIIFGFCYVAAEHCFLVVRCPECHTFIGIVKKGKYAPGELCGRCFGKKLMERRNNWATRHRFDNLPFEEEE